MTVHPHANAFDHSAEQYERGRPGYPDSLLGWIAARGRLQRTSTIVDLGGGTGKLTRLLVASPARVIAIEPIAAMREQFQHILPAVELLDATAENMPLADESVDIVACGQSIRWFANTAAFSEIARVLRTDGELIVTYNSPDLANPLQQRIEQVLKEVDTLSTERKPGELWRELLVASPYFKLVGEADLANPHTVERSGIGDRLYSSSQFARLPRTRQRQLIDELEQMAEGATIALDQVTTVLALAKVEHPAS